MAGSREQHALGAQGERLGAGGERGAPSEPGRPATLAGRGVPRGGRRRGGDQRSLSGATRSRATAGSGCGALRHGS